MRRHREAVTREVARHPGASVTWEERGSHDLARITFGDRAASITVSRTASCCRAMRNQIADVRRAIRNMRGA